MSDSEITGPLGQGKKFGPIWLAPGISTGNAVTNLYASFTTVSLLIYLSFIQPYLLTEILQIPLDQQGSITGRLASLQEVVVIISMSFIGALSDQRGRRFVYAVGFSLLGIGYFLYPLADSILQLTIFRLVFALGAACVPVMISAIAIDYTQPRSRGKWLGISSIVGGLGILFMTLVMIRIPTWLENAGFESDLAGQYTFWVGSAACIATAFILSIGLKGKAFDTGESKPNPFLTVVSGFKAVLANRKLAFACGTAFVGRGDLVIIGTFLPLWATQVGLAAGLTTGEALARAGLLLGVNQITIILAAYFAGYVTDRFDKIVVLTVAFTLAAVGYFGMWFIADPFNLAIVGAIFVLAVGEVTITVASNTLVGQEAPDESRGAILGVFGVMGAVGIAVATFIGGEIFDAVGKAAPFLMMVFFNIIIVVWAIYVQLSERREPQSS